jgi:hypothetical protein
MEPEPFVSPLREMMPLLMWGTIGLVAVFVILVLVRFWGWRTQRRGGSCGDLDLADLRRRMMAGEISPEEYEAVRDAIAGAAGIEPSRHADAGARRPIKIEGVPEPDEAREGGQDEAAGGSGAEHGTGDEAPPAAGEGEPGDSDGKAGGPEDDPTSGKDTADGKTD